MCGLPVEVYIMGIAMRSKREIDRLDSRLTGARGQLDLAALELRATVGAVAMELLGYK